MAAPSARITQRGLGVDEGDEAELVDAWWNPPAAPLTCPSTVPPPSAVRPVGTRVERQTISLEDLDE